MADELQVIDVRTVDPSEDDWAMILGMLKRARASGKGVMTIVVAKEPWLPPSPSMFRHDDWAEIEMPPCLGQITLSDFLNHSAT